MIPFLNDPKYGFERRLYSLLQVFRSWIPSQLPTASGALRLEWLANMEYAERQAELNQRTNTLSELISTKPRSKPRVSEIACEKMAPPAPSGSLRRPGFEVPEVRQREARQTNFCCMSRIVLSPSNPYVLMSGVRYCDSMTPGLSA